MATTEFIAAIEVSSSTVTGLAGKQKSDGSVQVLAYVQEDASSFIKKGIIYNLDKTTLCLTSIVSKLQSELKHTIAKVYVTTGGQSIRTERNTVSRNLSESTIITQEMVDSIYDENVESKLPNSEILEVVPQEYKIGNSHQIEPVGVAGNHIEGRFLNITARAALKSNLEHCFKQAKIEVADTFLTPLMTAHALLTDKERQSGCALIDFGADTTTVSVYHKNILRFLSVLPLGGNNITRDLTSLQIEEEEAERLKVAYGSLLYEEEENAVPTTYLLSDNNRTVEAANMNSIIEARMEELVANIFNQLELSGYGDRLLAGIILTGGASNLKNLDKYFSKKIKPERISDKVKVVRIPRFAVHTSNHAWKQDGSRNALFGIFLEKTENCCQPERPAAPVEPKPVEEHPKPVIPAPVPTQESLYDNSDVSWIEQNKLAQLKKEQLAKEERERKIREKEAKKLRDEEERALRKAEKEAEKAAKREAEGGGWFTKIAGKLNNVSKDLFDGDQDMK